jgi:hypothetical protein
LSCSMSTNMTKSCTSKTAPMYYMINQCNSVLKYTTWDMILCSFSRQAKIFCKNLLAACIFREENKNNGFFQNVGHTSHSTDP